MYWSSHSLHLDIRQLYKGAFVNFISVSVNRTGVFVDCIVLEHFIVVVVVHYCHLYVGVLVKCALEYRSIALDYLLIPLEYLSSVGGYLYWSTASS